MANIGHLKVCAEIRKIYVFFPVATMLTVGDVCVLTVFGIEVYCRVGSRRSLFGYVFGEEDEVA